MTVITKFSTALRLLRRSRHKKRYPRVTSVVGLIGRAETLINNQGAIFVRDELWPARADVSIAPGESVRVVGLSRDSLCLVVTEYPPMKDKE